MMPGASSRQPSRSRCNGRISTAWLAILRLSGVTFTPWPLTFFTSSRKALGLTPSSFFASSSIVFAVTLVTRLILYSSRSIGVTLASKICQANWPGWSSTTLPYFA